MNDQCRSVWLNWVFKIFSYFWIENNATCLYRTWINGFVFKMHIPYTTNIVRCFENICFGLNALKEYAKILAMNSFNTLQQWHWLPLGKSLFSAGTNAKHNGISTMVVGPTMVLTERNLKTSRTYHCLGWWAWVRQIYTYICMCVM